MLIHPISISVTITGGTAKVAKKWLFHLSPECFFLESDTDFNDLAGLLAYS